MLPRMRTRSRAKQAKLKLEAEKDGAVHRPHFERKQVEQDDGSSPSTSDASQVAKRKVKQGLGPEQGPRLADSHSVDPPAFSRASGEKVAVRNLGEEHGRALALTYLCSAFRPRNQKTREQTRRMAYRLVVDRRLQETSRPLPSKQRSRSTSLSFTSGVSMLSILELHSSIRPSARPTVLQEVSGVAYFAASSFPASGLSCRC